MNCLNFAPRRPGRFPPEIRRLGKQWDRLDTLIHSDGIPTGEICKRLESLGIMDDLCDVAGAAAC